MICKPLNPVGFGMILSILAGILGVLFNDTTTVRAEDGVVTFKVSRKKRDDSVFARCLMDVYVNGNKIGSVANGKDFVFTCHPTDSGQYSIFVEADYKERCRSKSVDLNVRPGGTVKVVGELEGWFLRESHVEADVVNQGSTPLKFVTAQLENDYVERELSREVVETLPGIKRTIKRSRTIEHTVSITETDGLDASIKAGIGVVSGEIRGRVEKALGQSFRQSETVEQTIEIDGNKLPEVSLQWVEKYRRGIASVQVNGVEKKVPFEFRENIELRIKRVGK